MKSYFPILFMTSVLALTACTSTQNFLKTAPFKLNHSSTKTASSRTALAPMVQYGASPGFGSAGVHTVLGGDTLWTIAKQYKLNTRDIIDANGLVPPFRLATGMRLMLPPPQTYRVKNGDNVPLVARVFAVSQRDLIALNNISAPYRLVVGQDLHLPHPIIDQAIDRHNPPVPQTKKQQYDVDDRSISSSISSSEIVREDLPPITLSPVSKNLNPQPLSNTPIKAGGVMVPPTKPALTQEASLPSQSTSNDVAIADENGLPPRTRDGFLKPVNGRILSRYGPKSGGLYNEGVNISAVRGTPVRAAESGRVVYVGNAVEGYGNLILIKHEGGYITAYAHLEKTFMREGQVVKRGHTIGTVGSSGNVDRAQLHFEIRKGRESIDPTKMI